MFQQAIAASENSRAGRGSLYSGGVALALIVAVAVATRIVTWWNPLAHVDDPFYLLAGRELLYGHFPYVDVWDRKPFGLFALYALIFAVTGGSFLAFNLVATSFAVATGMIVRSIARHFASGRGATLAGVIYVATIPMLGGQNGQSPVFYNLPMALAGLLCLRAVLQREKSLHRSAFGAMLLCGLAISVKQTAFVEGCWFGLTFLALMWRRDRSIAALLRPAAIMIALALAPIGLSIAAYYAAGTEAGDAYFYATFGSNLAKESLGTEARLNALHYVAMHIVALFFLAALGLVQMKMAGDRRRETLFVGGWIVAGLVGFLIIPNFFDHYAMPLVVSLSVAAAAILGHRLGWLLLATYSLVVVQDFPRMDRFGAENRVTRQNFEATSAVVAKARAGGCIFMAEGFPTFSLVHPPCRNTRYLFPEHLSVSNEVRSVDTNTAAELSRILASRPAVIMTQDNRAHRRSAAFNRFIAEMPQYYRSVFVSPPTGDPRSRTMRVWQRKDLPNILQGDDQLG